METELNAEIRGWRDGLNPSMDGKENPFDVIKEPNKVVSWYRGYSQGLSVREILDDPQSAVWDYISHKILEDPNLLKRAPRLEPDQEIETHASRADNPD